MIFTSWTLSTDSSLIFIRGVWNQLPKRMMLQLKSLFVICPLFRRLIFRMRRFELYEGNRCFEPFLFNPNLHALHNWKGTPLERIHCQALWRWNHDYTMNSMCKCSIFKLDTWCLMLHHNFMKRQCPELFSKMSNSEFLKHKISERMIAQPLFFWKAWIREGKNHVQCSTFFLHLLYSTCVLVWQKNQDNGVGGQLVRLLVPGVKAQYTYYWLPTIFPSFYDCFWKVVEYFW